MVQNTLSKPAILMVFIVLAVIGGWEIYLRSKGTPISYDDSPALWSDKRSMVYEPAEKATVFIGSSRIKFDLDIDTWQKITGRHAVQLAIVGSSPLPVLKDLASDKNFKGRLVVDVTEPFFFSTAPGATADPEGDIHYFKERTPAQKASFELNHVLESRLVFLDKQFLSLNAGLDKLHIPNRPGVFEFPLFPMGFGMVDFDRRSKMTDRFLADTILQRQVKNIWVFVLELGRKEPPPKVDPLPSILQSIKDATDKIKARGGEVVFLRTPSSGPFRAAELGGFPRSKYWDPLLAVTHCSGIHFDDYPAIAHFVCPEWSHLSSQDAIVFTKELIRILPRPFVQ